MMSITITKLDGYWRIVTNGAYLCTPYMSETPRAVVVSYARRNFPHAKIYED